MTSNANQLPREMMEHTYPILFSVEQSHWWHTGRRKILAAFVEEICREVTDRRPSILDVGCGTGANLLMLSTYGDAEGVDISQDALAFCRERGLDKVKLGAAEQLPYDDATFDLVTAFDVVEQQTEWFPLATRFLAKLIHQLLARDGFARLDLQVRLPRDRQESRLGPAVSIRF